MRRLKSGSEVRLKAPEATKMRRVLLLAAPGTQILDLVGPYQVFVRAAEIVARADSSAAPVYTVEVVTTGKGLFHPRSPSRE